MRHVSIEGRRTAFALRLICVSLWLTLAACGHGRVSQTGNVDTEPTSDRAAAAEEALVTFFAHLAAGQYDQAARLYGGSYEILQSWNPNVDPQDHATLWRNGCSINGLNCLAVGDVTRVDETAGGGYRFEVEFTDREGDLFVLLPCCGATETEQPPVSRWLIGVSPDASGRMLVTDLPPYQP